MDPTISSRTPEGVPNHCPVCHSELCLEPSQPAGDAPCPRCGTLLWFFPISAGMRYYEAAAVAPIRERIVAVFSKHLGVSEEQFASDLSSSLEDLGVDSLDLVELVMELEEELGLTIPDAAAEKFETLGDVIDWIIRHYPK